MLIKKASHFFSQNDLLQPGEEELHCLCPDSLCNEHVGIAPPNITLSLSSQSITNKPFHAVVLGEWGEYTYSASIVLGCFAALLVILVAICFICGIAN